MFTVYCAGPITGQEPEDVEKYFNNIHKSLKGYRILHPVAETDIIRVEDCYNPDGYKDSPIQTDHAIFARDEWMVRQCDILFANLTNSGDRISIGTVVEITMAYVLNKHIVAVIPKDNVHLHTFIRQCCSVVFETADEAINYLKFYNKGKM